MTYEPGTLARVVPFIGDFNPDYTPVRQDHYDSHLTSEISEIWQNLDVYPSL